MTETRNTSRPILTTSASRSSRSEWGTRRPKVPFEDPRSRSRAAPVESTRILGVGLREVGVVSQVDGAAGATDGDGGAGANEDAAGHAAFEDFLEHHGPAGGAGCAQAQGSVGGRRGGGGEKPCVAQELVAHHQLIAGLQGDG